MVVGQFFVRQVAHGLGEGAHGTNVGFAVFNHLAHERGVFAELPVTLRDRQ